MATEFANRSESNGSGLLTTAHLRNDFLASIVVFLVALPLCIGNRSRCRSQSGSGLDDGNPSAVLW